MEWIKLNDEVEVMRAPVTRAEYQGTREIEYPDDMQVRVSYDDATGWAERHGWRLLTEEEWLTMHKLPEVARVFWWEWTSTDVRGSGRVVRGGGWSNDAGYLRASNRDDSDPGYGCGGLGWRCVRPAKKEQPAE